MTDHESALALYAKACESHKRQDWRLACHALANSLKSVLASSAAMPATPATQDPAPVEPKAAPKAKASKGAKAPKASASHNDLSARSLTRALRLLCKVAPGKDKIPILNYVLIQAQGDSVVLTATDLDRKLAITLQAPDIGQWEATANAKDLLATVSKLAPGALVDLACDCDGKLTITAPGLSGKPPGLSPNDFPHMMADLESKPLARFSLPSESWSDALAHVAPSIDPNDHRYYLHGAYLCAVRVDGQGRLRLVSTDGHRLAVWDCPQPDVTGTTPRPVKDNFVPPFPGAIIPHGSVTILQSLLAYGETVESAVGTEGAIFEIGCATLRTKLIDGSFPDYPRVIPDLAKAKRSAHFMAPDMLEALKPLPMPKAGVRMQWEESGALISQRNVETGETLESRLSNADLQGEGLEIGFNLTNLRDAMRAYGEGAILAMGDSADPALLVPAKQVGETNRLHVLMPLRI